MDEMVTVSQKPLHEALELMDAMGPRLNAERSWIPSFTDNFVPALTRAGVAFARDAAGLASAQTAVAIERYRLANDDAVPERLQDLVPALLTAVPVDPFDGNPLRYRHDDTGYSLYSIGENMRDDGGTETTASPRERPPDVVFRVNRVRAGG
jgi:hypothetical protein